MLKKLPLLCLAAALAVPVATIAAAPRTINGATRLVKPTPPPQTKPPQHKGKCCAGRMQAQPRPSH